LGHCEHAALPIRLWPQLYKIFFDNLKVSQAAAKIGGSLEVSADVANIGSQPGDAVVQLYIHQRAGSTSRPVRQLKGFQRVNLPGAQSRPSISL
jgi:beta-glucosidase